MTQESDKKTLKTGTTTVGIVCDNNGVILASDKRATMGYLIASKDIDKIHSIADHIGMTIAGSVGDAQTLIRWMRSEIKLYELRNGVKMPVKSAATLLSNILANYKFYPFFVQILVGGYDKSPKLYSIDMAGGITEEHIASTGSGSPIAYGVLESSKNIKTIEDGVRVAATAVNSAMKRDAASGERVDVVIIDENGFRRLSKEEINSILSGKKVKAKVRSRRKK